MSVTQTELAREVETHAAPIRALTTEVERVVVGQSVMVSRLLIGLLTGGHVLLEGVPCLAKTLTISTLARAVHADFARLQFTPDLLPADLSGTLIYSPKDGTFSPRKGPIFANLVLADEISPDCCRLWDINTSDKLDKDRFRRDLGGEVEAYQEVARRLGIMVGNEPTVPRGPVLVK